MPESWTWVDPRPLPFPGTHHATFESSSMKREVGYCVYLPPGYEETPDTRYPVVYFLHGAGGTERSDVGFSTGVHAAIRSGKIPAAIYVFPNGGARSGYRDWKDGSVRAETLIIGELIPHIDEKYRTLANRSGRAITGFSMGGSGAIRLALKHPEMFCAAASFAGAFAQDAHGSDGDNAQVYAERNAAKIRDRVGLYLVVGDEDFLHDRHIPLAGVLDGEKIPYRLDILPGVGHSLGRYAQLRSSQLIGFLAEKLAPPTRTSSPGTRPRFDIAILGGRVHDGTGSPWYTADIGVVDGRIAHIGRVPASDAETTIHATGLVVAPGFIDMMGQTATPLLRDPRTALNLLTQGITTINAGEGGSAAPLSEEEGRRQGWTTFAEYFTLLDLHGLPVNVVQTIGHTQVRRLVLGDEDRQPDAAEMARMRDLVREAMEAGAIGVSTALIYPPAVYAKTEEIASLAAVAGEYGGSYYTHMRNEGDRLLEAIDEALEIGRRGKTPVHIFHLKAAGEKNWPKMRLAIERIRRARAEGQAVTADIYPYVNNGLGIAALIHPRHFAQGREALLRRLDDSALRAEIRREMLEAGGWENWFRHAGGDWNRIVVGRSNVERYKLHDGKSVAEIAKAVDEDPWHTFFELVRAGAFALPETMTVANKILAMRENFVSFCTDVGPAGGSRSTSHPRAFGAFPRLLARYVRELGAIPLERAIAQASATAANSLHIRDRGRIAVGLAADLIVFDEKKIVDRASFSEPGAVAEGMRDVLVGGVPVLRSGKLLSARPGRVLRGPGRREQLAAENVSSPSTDDRFAPFDREVEAFLRKHQVPGLSIAMTQHGRVVYARGYGYADVGRREPVRTESLFRIASISKPITAVAVLKLIEDERLKLEDRWLEVVDLEREIREAGDRFDPRLRKITIRQLLEHRGGWDRQVSFDAMFQSVRFAEQRGVEAPAGPGDVIQAMLSVSLDFDPGTRYAYSNLGYCILGRIIEKISGDTYAHFVQRKVLNPIGVTSMRIGRTRLEHRAENEVRYYHPALSPSVFARDRDQLVPNPYGAWHLEAMDAHGGWIASATDLARFAAAFDDPDRSPILTRRSIELMHRRPEKSAEPESSSGRNGKDEERKQSFYSLGWSNRIAGSGRMNHWHSGSLPGTATILIRRHDGKNLVGLLNTRVSPATRRLGLELDRLLHRAANAVENWPTE